MPLHPQSQALLAALAARNRPSLADVPLPVARDMVADFSALQADPGPVTDVLDILVSGAAGRIPVRIYRPAEVADTVRPLLVYFHGGGWATGSLDLVDRPLRTLAAATGAVVASVGYRLAPETKFPGPAEDCYAALVELHGRAAEWGADPGTVVVAGDSAGGNLAAVVCLMARDRGRPIIASQVLLYPVTAPARDSPFDSYRDNAEGYLLTRDTMCLYWDHYLPSGADGSHPYASPLHAETLTGLPPALIITAEFDPLRDEGEAYARRLHEAKVPVTARRYAGLIHGFFWLPGTFDAFDDAVEDIVTHLASRFDSHLASDHLFSDRTA